MFLESTTVQKWLRMGREEGRLEVRCDVIRNLFFRLGRKKFGPPNANITARVAAEQDVERLESLAERVLDANSWDDLFAE